MQTSVRYFYTDPLAAAWMAKHHGMKFSDGGVLDNWPDIEAHFKEFDILYIHHNSFNLLEPQAGDILHSGVQAFGIVEKQDGTLTVVNDIYPAPHFKLGIPKWFSIIQRNGKAFHWPEVENEKAR